MAEDQAAYRSRRFDLLKERLKGSDMSDSYAAVEEIKDFLDRSYYFPEQPNYFAQIIPDLIEKLNSIPCHNTRSRENMIRHSILDMLHRCTNIDSLRNLSLQLLKAMDGVMVQDNEENAAMAIKIFIELSRNFKDSLIDSPIIDKMQKFAERVFGNSEEIMRNMIERPSDALIPSIDSYKVLIECGNCMSSLYNIGLRRGQALKDLILHAFEIVCREDYETYYNTSSYNDFLHFKTKIFIFLIEFSSENHFEEEFKHHEDQFSNAIINLMKALPPDNYIEKKELLEGFTYIIKSVIQPGFFKYIDEILDEGENFNISNTIRSTWFSFIMEFIEHFKNDMSLVQLCNATALVCRNIHLYVQLHFQSLNVLRSILEKVKGQKDANRHTRDRNSEIIELIYQIILLNISERLEYCCSITDDEVEQQLQMSHQPTSQRQIMNIHEAGALHKRLLELAKHVINEKVCQPGPESTHTGILEDEETVTYISKIFRYSILFAKVYASSKNLEREELETYETIAYMLCLFHPTSLQDLLEELFPFLFVRFIESQNISKLLENIKKNSRDTQRQIGDVIISFVVENLEILEQDSDEGETKLIELYDRAGIRPSREHDGNHISKRLYSLIEMVLNHEVLELHGVRLIKKCEELCKNESVSKFVVLAKNCVSLAFKIKNLREKLLLTWIEKQEPLYELNPPEHVIFQNLCSSSPEKIQEACIVMLENIKSIEVNPILLKRLYKLLHSPDKVYFSELLSIIGKLAPEIRDKRLTISVKSWDSFPSLNRQEPYNFPFPYIYSQNSISLYSIYIPLEYILAKITKCFKTMVYFEEKGKRTIEAASKVITSSAISYLNKLPIDPRVIMAKSNFLLTNEHPIGFEFATPVIFSKIQQDSIESSFKFTLESLISLVAIDENNERLKDLYKNFCKHIGFLAFSSLEVHPIDYGFNIEEIFEVLCSKVAHKDKGGDLFITALEGMTEILNTIQKILHNNEAALNKSISMNTVLLCLIKSCYKSDWNEQIGAAGALVRLIKMFPAKRLEENASQIVEAALHIIECNNSSYESQLLEEPVKLFNAMSIYIPEEELLEHLVNSLLSTHSLLRMIARRILKEKGLLLALKKSEIVCIYFKEPFELEEVLFNDNYYKERFRRHVFFELLSFSIKEHLIDLSEAYLRELVGIINELVLEAREKYTSNELSRNRSKIVQKQPMENHLKDEKVAIFDLMKEFISSVEIQQLLIQEYETYITIKNNIAFSFLRAMGSTEENEIIAIVREAIELMMKNEFGSNAKLLLPCSDLKFCLRPILSELAKNTELPALDTLINFSRLLQVIPNYFNRNVGDKLLRHLHEASNDHAREKLPLIHAIINLFHIMPDCISEIFENTINGFIRSEETLQKHSVQGYLNSPFHLSLIKFLVRFPEETNRIFFNEKSRDKKMTDYLVSLLDHPKAYKLRELVADNYEYVINKFLVSDTPDLVYQGMKIINAITRNIPRWISTKEDLVDCIYDIWYQQQFKPIVNEEDIIKHSFLEKHLIKCFINLLRYNKSKHHIAKLLELPNSFNRKIIWNSEFLQEFLNKELPELLSVEQKVDLMKMIMKNLHNPSISDNEKYKLIEYLAIPFLTESFKLGQTSQVVNKNIQVSTAKLIRKHLNDFSKIFCVQLMNLGSLFIENMKEEFYNHRKELIKFFWGMIKSENPLIKGSAYVNVARFINVYSLPDTLTVQLLGALLKAHHSELSSNAHQAFGYLSERLKILFRDVRFREHLGDFVYKHLQNEAKDYNSIMHVIEIIIKNSEVFYHIRKNLSHHFFYWINQLGLEEHTNFRAKKTLLDLTNLMIIWSEKHFEEVKESYITTSHKEMLINFFARFGQAPALYISRTPTKNPDHMNLLSVKCISNMNYALKIWEDVNFKARNWTEALKKCVNLVEEEHEQEQQRGGAAEGTKKLLERSLVIIKILAENSTGKDIIEYPELIKYLAHQVKSTDNPGLIKHLCEILELLLKYESADLFTELNEILESAMKEAQQNYLWYIKILNVISEASPEEILNHMKSLMSMCVSLINDLAQNSEIHQKEKKIESLETGLVIIEKNLGELREKHKKQLRKIVEMVFECYIDPKIMQEAVEIMSKWVDKENEEMELDIKYECVLLLELFSSDKLLVNSTEEPLNLALKVLKSEAVCYESKISLLKAIYHFFFMYPYHAKKPAFDQIFKDMLDSSVWRVLLFIFEECETNESKEWIKLSVDLLLSVLEDYEIEELQETDYEMEDGDRELTTLIRDHTWNNTRLYQSSFKSAKDLILPLRDLRNSLFANYIFINIFPQIWSSLTRSQESTLSLMIENFLLKPKNIDELTNSASKTVLVALTSCRPFPTIHPQILQYVAKTQNCWSIVVPILESYTKYLPQHYESKMYLTGLYERLSEDEQALGWTLKSVDTKMKKALKEEISRNWEKSREILEEILSEGTDESSCAIAEQYEVKCIKKLGDWESLNHYSEIRQDLNSIESYWYLGHTEKLQNFIENNGLENQPQSIYYECVSELEKLCDEPTSHSVIEIEKKLEELNKGLNKEWSYLPFYPVKAHVPLVELIELKTELSDGLQICRKLEDHFIEGSQEDICENWNETDLKCENGPSFWESLFRSRKIIMKVMKVLHTRLPSATSSDHENFHPQTSMNIHYANALRNQKLITKATEIIKQTPEDDYSNGSFRKWIETMRIAIDSQEYSTALSLADTTVELDFTSEEKSDFYRLKAKVRARFLEEYEQAIDSYLMACQTCETNYKNWLSWGEFLVEEYERTENYEIAAQASACLLLGLHWQNKKTGLYFPMLMDVLEKSIVNETLSESISEIPIEFMVDWVLDYIERFERNEEVYNLILDKLVIFAPEELFFVLRKSLIEAKELGETEKGARLEKKMVALKETHTVLAETLEVLASSLERDIRPSLIEDLYSSLVKITQLSENLSSEGLTEYFYCIKQKIFSKEDEVLSELAAEFFEDFPEESLNPSTILPLIQKWTEKLLSIIKISPKEYLFKKSPIISSMIFSDISIPGSRQSVFIERFLPEIKPIFSKNCNRLVYLRGTDSHEYSFLITTVTPYQNSHYNRFRLSKIFNTIFEVHINELGHRLPASDISEHNVIPLDPRHALVQFDSKSISLLDICLESCEMAEFSPYEEIRPTEFTSKFFSFYIERALESPDRFMVFKEQFTAEFALLHLLMETFSIPMKNLGLHEVWVSKSNGKINWSLIESEPEIGEFNGCRLTPNVVEMIGEGGIYGVMPVVITGAVRGLLKKKLIIEYVLRAFSSEECLERIEKNRDPDNVLAALEECEKRVEGEKFPWF